MIDQFVGPVFEFLKDLVLRGLPRALGVFVADLLMTVDEAILVAVMVEPDLAVVAVNLDELLPVGVFE